MLYGPAASFWQTSSAAVDSAAAGFARNHTCIECMIQGPVCGLGFHALLGVQDISVGAYCLDFGVSLGLL